MECPKCKKQLDETDKFCGSCGEKIYRKSDTKPKGTQVKKMRKLSVILYAIVAVWNIGNYIYLAIKTELESDSILSNMFIIVTVFVIVNLIIEKNQKLQEIKPWYKSKWGWFEAFMLFNIVSFVIYWIGIIFRFIGNG